MLPIAKNKNTNMILNNSQIKCVVEEYFKTKSFDLCCERFELKFPGWRKDTKQVNNL